MLMQQDIVTPGSPFLSCSSQSTFPLYGSVNTLLLLFDSAGPDAQLGHDRLPPPHDSLKPIPRSSFMHHAYLLGCFTRNIRNIGVINKSLHCHSPRIFVRNYRRYFPRIHTLLGTWVWRWWRSLLSQDPIPQAVKPTPTPVLPASRLDNMQSYIQLLSTPTADTAGTSLILDVGQKRYLFGNIHEGLQRVCIQRGSRLPKTTQVFISGKTEWKNLGGLFGVILTIADATASAVQSVATKAIEKKTHETPKQNTAKSERKAKADAGRARIFLEAGLDPEHYIGGSGKDGESPNKVPTLTIHGGENLTHTIATGRRFIFRKGMPVEVNELTSTEEHAPIDEGRNPDWTDDCIQVWKLPIKPASQSKISNVSPETPRKRSFDEFVGVDAPSPRNLAASVNHSVGDNASDITDDELRRSVVSAMFKSEWRLDALFETPLKDVKLPAKIWRRNTKTNKIYRYYPPEDGTLPEINVLVRKAWPGALIKRLPLTEPSTTAMSYIVRHYPQRGKFILEKAKALNVHPWIFQPLQNGATVKSQDGVTVTPEMVMEPRRNGGGFAMVDIPSVEYLHNLLGRQEWKTPRIVNGLQAIVWNLGPGVAGDMALHAFIQEHATIKHIVAAPDISPNYITLDSSASLIIRLNQIDSQRYPIPKHSNISPLIFSSRGPSEDKALGYVCAVRDYQLQLEPRFEEREPPTKQPFLDTKKVLEDMPKEVLELAQNVKTSLVPADVAGSLTNQGLPGQDVEIVCLGTGSSAPSKYRNVSATLLRVPGSGTYLFDCGEGTLGQLRRLYTPTELIDVLRDLKMIWISHMHADHHLGIAGVIRAWYEANHGPTDQSPELDHDGDWQNTFIRGLQLERKLFVFGGVQMIRWLEEYSCVEDFGHSKLMTITTDPAQSSFDPDRSHMQWEGRSVGFNIPDEPIHEAMRQATGLRNLVTCSVDHCVDAQAVSITFPSGFKFSYSGDCRPSSRFVQIGRGSTVLIHEATFDDDMQTDADAKKHSTMSEAIGVALAMGAKRLLLTHFSQRYQKIPELGALDRIRLRFDDVEASANPAEGAGSPPDPENMSHQFVRGNTHIDHEHSELDYYNDQLDREEKASPSKPQAWYISDATLAALPVIAQGSEQELKIAIAFDLLRVRVGEIAYLENFLPVFQRLFEISEQEGKAKAFNEPGAVAQRKREEEKRKRTELKSQKKSNRQRRVERMATDRARSKSPKRACVGSTVDNWWFYLAVSDYTFASQRGYGPTGGRGTRVPIDASFESPFIGQNEFRVAQWLEEKPEEVNLDPHFFGILDKQAERIGKVVLCKRGDAHLKGHEVTCLLWDADTATLTLGGVNYGDLDDWLGVSGTST
ncbi:MAG: hypothetical protein Q9218_005045 [Villophora microphyllina]